jgi:hypothetical protein
VTVRRVVTVQPSGPARAAAGPGLAWLPAAVVSDWPGPARQCHWRLSQAPTRSRWLSLTETRKSRTVAEYAPADRKAHWQAAPAPARRAGLGLAPAARRTQPTGNPATAAVRVRPRTPAHCHRGGRDPVTPRPGDQTDALPRGWAVTVTGPPARPGSITDPRVLQQQFRDSNPF